MLTYLLFFVGIYLLIQGANYLVDGSSALAKRFGVSTLVVGLTIVAFGTSMPELVVNVISALKGVGDIAFGNIIGSNIANIALILGITAAIAGIKISHSTIWKEIPFSLLAVLVLIVYASAQFLDNTGAEFIFRSSGIVLLLFFAIFLYYAFELAKKSQVKIEETAVTFHKHSMPRIIGSILGGLIALYLGGQWTVDGAVAIAKLLGLSEYLISLTVIAIGTSLPELVTSVAAAIKKMPDMAVGNIVGSNIFNILWILGVTAIIRPLPLPHFANIDLFILLAITALLFVFMFIGRKHELERWQGISFLAIYAIYLIYIVLR